MNEMNQNAPWDWWIGIPNQNEVTICLYLCMAYAIHLLISLKFNLDHFRYWSWKYLAACLGNRSGSSTKYMCRG